MYICTGNRHSSLTFIFDGEYHIFFDALAKKHETFFDFGPYQVDLSGNEVAFIPLLYHPVNPKYDDLVYRTPFLP